VQLPVMESAGMLSPLVIKDILQDGGDALQQFVDDSSCPIAGANLCISSREQEKLTCEEMEQLIVSLIENRMSFQ
jgi:hypothetical protein